MSQESVDNKTSVYSDNEVSGAMTSVYSDNEVSGAMTSVSVEGESEASVS